MRAELAIKWTTCRARDSYGYNVCTMVGNIHIHDERQVVKARCLGGGYDMLGTCLADVAQQIFPDWFNGTGRVIELTPDVVKEFYGLRVRDDGTAWVEGAAGVECVERILKKLIGASVKWEYSRDRQGRIKDKSGVVIVWGESDGNI